jgi:alkylation response protein AidB-like acyl-CoA dehydrogenase
MDLTLDPDQETVLEAVSSMLRKAAGPERTRLVGAAGHDDDLLKTLLDGGYLDLFHDKHLGPLGATLVVEEMSRHNARVNGSVRALVGPALLGPEVPRRLAVTRRSAPGPVRFGQHADVLLILDGEEAYAADVLDAHTRSGPYGFPYAEVRTGPERRLGTGRGPELEAWWRVAIAAEISGAAQGAVDHTVEYLSHRKQFGKPLGSLQAIQHRLAELHVWSAGSRWLARAAGYHRARPERAAVAAAYAAQAAQLIGSDLHQLSGAIGFTNEFDLQQWTTRLHALRVELGGVTAHQVATAAAYWG